jgi:hypothetical protein
MDMVLPPRCLRQVRWEWKTIPCLEDPEREKPEGERNAELGTDLPVSKD